MVQLSELVRYCDALLDVPAFRDYSPNGLQVEGRGDVNRLVSGVTASAAFLDRATDVGADAVLVHHGYFWKGESPRIVGPKARRLRTLLRHEVSLLAYHLPLDAHLALGNNTCLGERLGVREEGRAEAGGVSGLLAYGRLGRDMAPDELGAQLKETLGRSPLHVGEGPGRIRRVAWCTGAAQDFLGVAVELGADAYISGEISERTTHEAREYGIHYFAAGHHATERFGVQALGEHLAAEFGIEHEFVDVDNPA